MAEWRMAYHNIMEKQGDFQQGNNHRYRLQRTTSSSDDYTTSISNLIEDSATAEEDDLQKNDVDNELALIEKAFDYLTRKTYPPPGCSKNDKSY